MTGVLQGRGGGGTSGGTSGRTSSAARRSASVLVTAVLAAAGVALSGFASIAAVVLVAWVTDARDSASSAAAVRAAADAWLLAHGGSLRTPVGTVALVPLGLTALPVVLLYRAGAALARTVEVADLRAAAATTAALAGGYAVLVAGAARLAGTATAGVGVLPAGLGAFLLAAVAGGAGLVRAAGLGAALAGGLPRPVVPVARAAGVALGALLAAGAALAAVSLAGHGGRASELTRALDPGLVGGVLLLGTGIVLAPNAVVWSAAYVAGPGFAVGAGTGVSPFGVVLGPVPAFPLLAALPAGDPPAAVRAVLVLPLLAGVLAGFSLARAGGGQRARTAAGYGGLAGLAAGAGMALLAAVSGGPAGDGYLTAVGPSPWRVGLAVALEVGIPAALVAALAPPAAGGGIRAAADSADPGIDDHAGDDHRG